MNLDFRLRDPVDDNNSEEINLPQMQESRYRGNPEGRATYKSILVQFLFLGLMS
jgi:hypothetical protein